MRIEWKCATTRVLEDEPPARRALRMYRDLSGVKLDSCRYVINEST